MSLAVRRISTEYKDVLGKKFPEIFNLEMDETNVHIWRGLLVPRNEPYNKGAFKFEIEFPNNFPFKAPKITFMTKIYHPNIDDKGKICLVIINEEHWKPSARIFQVFESLIKIIDEPEPDHPLRADVAEEYVKEKVKFLKKAKSHTSTNAEKRPANK